MDINETATFLAGEAIFELREHEADIEKLSRTIHTSGTRDAIDLDISCLRESVKKIERYLLLISG